MKRLSYLLLLFLSLVLYVFTARGSLGNPSALEIEQDLSVSGQAFETSQERSRYALILSLYYDHTFAIDNYASMGTPDIGRINGHYFSFFPPAASVLALPLYVLGLTLNAPQMAVFSLSTIFALLTILLIFAFSQKLKLHWSIGLFAALAFGFATNAWGYSVTFYAHLISAFLLLFGLYIALFGPQNKILKSSLIWFAYAAAVFVDFPNLFIFLPIALMHFVETFSTQMHEISAKLRIYWPYFLTPLIFVLCMGIYGYFNLVNFGSPTKLSNTIPRVRDISHQESTANIAVERGKSSANALNPRNMLNGIYTFLISPDRGVLVYSPVVLLFIFGVGTQKEIEKKREMALLMLPATCLTLYSMFGDPWGGWAFGSRYMIAVLPQLIILAGLGLARFHKNVWVKIFFSVVFAYSAAVSLLAPLTTNVVPPVVEAKPLGLTSDYRVNLRMLQKNELNSFVYNHVLKGTLPATYYYGALLMVVVLSGFVCIWYPKGTHSE
ncbi:hypothetical protein C4579_02370 [Candidatus Microgenomates bacterium]|nr:MAG: hypothetical protein C4579_02370 [Candidatus Microgenomates bacterium]